MSGERFIREKHHEMPPWPPKGIITMTIRDTPNDLIDDTPHAHYRHPNRHPIHQSPQPSHHDGHPRTHQHSTQPLHPLQHAAFLTAHCSRLPLHWNDLPFRRPPRTSERSAMIPHFLFPSLPLFQQSPMWRGMWARQGAKRPVSAQYPAHLASLRLGHSPSRDPLPWLITIAHARRLLPRLRTRRPPRARMQPILARQPSPKLHHPSLPLLQTLRSPPLKVAIKTLLLNLLLMPRHMWPILGD